VRGDRNFKSSSPTSTIAHPHRGEVGVMWGDRASVFFFCEDVRCKSGSCSWKDRSGRTWPEKQFLRSKVYLPFPVHPQQLEISLIPCTTSSIFTAPHGYLVGTWPIIFARADPKPSIVLTFSLPENANFEAHYVSFGACRLVRIHSEPPAIRTKKSLDFGLLCRNVYEALVGTLDRGLSYRRM
jgi:hypothetical protein